MSLQFTLNIDMGNAAFEDGDLYEVKRILHDLVKNTWDERFAFNGSDTGTLRDINGNKVGQWRVAEEPKPRYYWMYSSNVEAVTVYQMTKRGDMSCVVPWTPRGFRNEKQAVREELVKRGLMQAPVKGPNGGWIYGDDVELFQL